jgi:thioesterase domain-containing protein
MGRAVAKLIIVDPIEETQGERCRSFWDHLIARHSLEASYSKPTKHAYRWREIPELRLVVAQYVSFAKNQVGVFVRGERSVAPAAVYGRLKPFASGLQKALRCELFSDTKYFFHKGKKFQTQDTAQWDEMAAWLHKNANAYQDALRRIIRGVA